MFLAVVIEVFVCIIFLDVWGRICWSVYWRHLNWFLREKWEEKTGKKHFPRKNKIKKQKKVFFCDAKIASNFYFCWNRYLQIRRDSFSGKCLCKTACHQKGPIVCGTDNTSYPSECHLSVRSCKNTKLGRDEIRVKHFGECRKFFLSCFTLIKRTRNFLFVVIVFLFEYSSKQIYLY